MNIIITAPSLDSNINVSGISSVTNFIIDNNPTHHYIHFKLGKGDHDRGRIAMSLRILKAYYFWFCAMIFKENIFVHFNLALEKRSLIRDTPLILFSRLLGKRMVIHLHGGEYLREKDVPNWIRSILKSILSGKEIKITLSQSEKDVIIKKYSARNVVSLPNCVEIKEAQKFNRNYINENPLNLLFFGRIVERKGIDIILQALKILKEKGIDFKFIMAGAGPDQEKYVREFYSSLGSAFEFNGVVAGAKKNELLSRCDIFLLPSLFGEGLPMSLLECMSYGMTAIVTDDGSMKNVITTGENGIIVEKGSASSLSNVIINLIQDERLLEKIGKNARQYVFENHDPDAYIEKLNKIYNYD
jgi:glycosyltransferase involved in cell wall biosynthesis